MSLVILYLGAILPLIWGIAHLIPTRNVVAGFGDISEDNHNIITMEWIVEGVSLVFIGTLVGVVTSHRSIRGAFQGCLRDRGCRTPYAGNRLPVHWI